MFDDRSPIYRQIADQIRRDILGGVLREEDQVMSTTQYALHHRINPATAAKAFQQLVDDGVLYKRRGVGMFVAPGAAEHLRHQRRGDFIERVVAPLVDEAHRLGIPLDELIDLVSHQYVVADRSADADTDARAATGPQGSPR